MNYILAKEVSNEKSRSEKFFRECNRYKNEMEATLQAQRCIMADHENLISENVQLKIAFELASRIFV